MKNTRNKYFKTICSIVIIIAITCTTSLSAQPDTGTDPEDTTDAIPLDGGLTALLIGAAAFGMSKLRGNKKRDV